MLARASSALPSMSLKNLSSLPKTFCRENMVGRLVTQPSPKCTKFTVTCARRECYGTVTTNSTSGWACLLQNFHSTENRADHFAMIDLQPFATRDLQFAGIQAKLTQDRGVDVGDVMAILHGGETQFIGHAMLRTALDPPARQPRTEALRVMVATRPLGAR